MITDEDDSGYISKAMAIASKIMPAFIVLLFTAVLVVVVLHIYWRYLSGNDRGSFRRRRLAFVGEQEPSRLQNVGLAKSAIEALPVLVYRTENHKEGLQCAVCLCEFEEKEKARLLPRCHHSFHIDCIDMWFHSHSTCPLCRTSVQPDTLADSVVVLIVDEEATSATSSEMNQQVFLPNVSEGNASISMEPNIDIDFCPSCRHDELLLSPTCPSDMLFYPTQNNVFSS